ncbi:MAG TPA: hypothetical protein VF285_11335 [Castellaniella sp.]|uniref:hypothetical protein n=1 Tax=Castellaniella sp. TaxID=1955812 RepID=UPI002EF70652
MIDTQKLRNRSQWIALRAEEDFALHYKIADALDAQAAEIARLKDLQEIISLSGAAALERAGVETVDDPGEAIDALVADKDREIARLREASARALHSDAVADAAMEDNRRLREIVEMMAAGNAEYDVLQAAAQAALAQEQGEEK